MSWILAKKKNSFFKKDFKIILKKFRFFLFQMVFITSIQSLKSSKLLWLPDMNELLLCFFFKLYIDCFTVLVTFEINSSSWAYFAQWLKKKNESIGRIDQNRSKWINSGNLQEKEIFIIHWQKRKENKKNDREERRETTARWSCVKCGGGYAPEAEDGGGEVGGEVRGRILGRGDVEPLIKLSGQWGGILRSQQLKLHKEEPRCFSLLCQRFLNVLYACLYASKS